MKAMINNALHQKVQSADKITIEIFRAIHLHFVHLLHTNYTSTKH